jgi:hypothetical protein
MVMRGVTGVTLAVLVHGGLLGAGCSPGAIDDVTRAPASQAAARASGGDRFDDDDLDGAYGASVGGISMEGAPSFALHPRTAAAIFTADGAGSVGIQGWFNFGSPAFNPFPGATTGVFHLPPGFETCAYAVQASGRGLLTCAAGSQDLQTELFLADGGREFRTVDADQGDRRNFGVGIGRRQLRDDWSAADLCGAYAVTLEGETYDSATATMQHTASAFLLDADCAGHAQLAGILNPAPAALPATQFPTTGDACGATGCKNFSLSCTYAVEPTGVGTISCPSLVALSPDPSVPSYAFAFTDKGDRLRVLSTSVVGSQDVAISGDGLRTGKVSH